MATMVNTRYLNNIVVLPVNNQFRDRIITDLRAALAREHNFNARDERALTILDWNQFRSLVTNLSAGLQILLTIIGTLTLGIGAVGVMNIMLVSVTERTREIGVLKALGAHSFHILARYWRRIDADDWRRSIGLSPGNDNRSNDRFAAIIGTAIRGYIRPERYSPVSFHIGIAGFEPGFDRRRHGRWLAPRIRAARLDPAIAIRNE